MAVTLAQAAALSEDDLQAGVLEVFVQTSSILDRIPLMDVEGNAYAYNIEASLPGVAFRAVNEAYVESTGTFNQRTETLAILGGDADVDTFIQRTRSNLNDQRATQTALKVKAASYAYQDTFFNGNIVTNPKAFDGLGRRLTGAQVLDSGANGSAIQTDDASRNAFFDRLDALIAAVPGIDGSNGALYANAAIIGKVRSAGRRLGGVEMVREDLTGKRVVTWNGIPVLDPGSNLLGVSVLPQTETAGTSVNTSSVYAVKFGDDEGDGGVTGLTNGGVQVKDLGEISEKPVFRTRLEFFCGLAVFGGTAAARLTGVINA